MTQEMTKLQELLDAALQAKEAYWDAARAVEKYTGVECDAVGLTTDEMVDMTAEELVGQFERQPDESEER